MHSPEYLTERTDEELIAAFVGGDLAAFDEIYDRYEMKMIVFHSVRWPSECEELAQETFIRLARYPDRYDSRVGPFKPWLYRVAANAQYDYWRRHLLKWARLTLVSDMSAGDTFLTDVVIKINSSDDRIYLRQILETLEATDREILILYSEGHSDADIAAVLNARRIVGDLKRLTPKGVSSRRARALQKMKEATVRYEN